MQNFNEKTLVIIPSRIGATRLPRKPLLEIGEKTMVERVAENVLKSGLTNVFVATDSEEIVSVLEKNSVECIMTDSACQSGTDRIYEAWQNLQNKNQYNFIINVQGDMPFIEPNIIREVAQKLWETESDIITPVVRTSEENAKGESNVKVVSTNNDKALYFSRSMIPNSAKEYLYHVGVYGYKANSLKEFVSLSPSYLEQTERLEQLRALENGMSIEICYVDTIPISVDTQEDLEKAIKYYESAK